MEKTSLFPSFPAVLWFLIIRVPRFQHRLKPRRLLLPPPLGAGLLKPPPLAELLQRLLALQLPLEPADSSLHRFTLLESYFNHTSNSAYTGAVSRTLPALGRHAFAFPGNALRPSQPSASHPPLLPTPRSNRNHR